MVNDMSNSSYAEYFKKEVGRLPTDSDLKHVISLLPLPMITEVNDFDSTIKEVGGQYDDFRRAVMKIKIDEQEYHKELSKKKKKAWYSFFIFLALGALAGGFYGGFKASYDPAVSLHKSRYNALTKEIQDRATGEEKKMVQEIIDSIPSQDWNYSFFGTLYNKRTGVSIRLTPNTCIEKPFYFKFSDDEAAAIRRSVLKLDK